MTLGSPSDVPSSIFCCPGREFTSIASRASGISANASSLSSASASRAVMASPVLLAVTGVAVGIVSAAWVGPAVVAASTMVPVGVVLALSVGTSPPEPGATVNVGSTSVMIVVVSVGAAVGSPCVWPVVAVPCGTGVAGAGPLSQPTNTRANNAKSKNTDKVPRNFKTTSRCLDDLLNNLRAVESHVVEEDRVQQVTVVGEDA